MKMTMKLTMMIVMMMMMVDQPGEDDLDDG